MKAASNNQVISAAPSLTTVLQCRNPTDPAANCLRINWLQKTFVWWYIHKHMFMNTWLGLLTTACLSAKWCRMCWWHCIIKSAVHS